MNEHVAAYRASVQRLHDLVTPLGPEQLEASAYPTEWSIADVVSHVGTGAVLSLRRIESGRTGVAIPDEFAPALREEWRSKSPSEQAADGLAADEMLIDLIESFTPEELDGLSVAMGGPEPYDGNQFVARMLAEHVLHTWDVEVALDDDATLQNGTAALLLGEMEFVGRYTSKPTGVTRTITAATSDPTRGVRFELEPKAVSLTLIDQPADADLTIPAEACVRLVCGRLDPAHTPPVRGDTATLDELRHSYPGI